MKRCETCNDYMIESKNCLHNFKDGNGCSNWTDKQPISEDKTRYIYDNVLGMIDAFNAPVNLPRYAKAEYTTDLETKLEKMTSSCLENLAQKLQYRNIIDDLKNISPDHVSYLKVLSEKDQQIEDMKCCGNCNNKPNLKDCYKHCIRAFPLGYTGPHTVPTKDNWQMKDK